MKTQVLSFNLRVNTDHDGPYAWRYRMPHVFRFLDQNKSDIMGFQEVTPDMYQDLKKHLKDYITFGTPRDAHGEATPVFIRKDRFDVVESKTLWLSETNEKESKIEGSHFARIVTYVILRENDKMIVYFNTHLDYASDEVCKKQAIILSRIIDDVIKRYACEFILSGDFNTDPYSKTIQYMNQHYHSIYEETPHQLTFHGFTHQTKGLPIDYFFMSKHVRTSAFQVDVKQPIGNFLSDHYPLIAYFEI